MRTDQIWFLLGAVLAFLSVAIGAFAAHGLRARISADSLALIETGARYQMYHSLALLVVALAGQRWDARFESIAGGLFVAGILLFCGSLYALALSGVRVLGAITPLGGFAFLAGWVVLAVAAVRG